MTTQKTTSLPSLTTKQLAYCTHRAKGENKARSYLLAGYKAANSEQAGSAACKLEAANRVASYIATLKESSFLANALTLAEKRNFLARAVRCDISNPDADLIQELVETQGEQGTTRKLKVVSKLEAINIDNKMAGDNFSDKHDTGTTNYFQFIVGLSKGINLTNQQQLGSPSNTIESEIIPS